MERHYLLMEFPNFLLKAPGQRGGIVNGDVKVLIYGDKSALLIRIDDLIDPHA